MKSLPALVSEEAFALDPVFANDDAGLLAERDNPGTGNGRNE